jgi:hypothetical protein
MAIVLDVPFCRDFQFLWEYRRCQASEREDFGAGGLHVAQPGKMMREI